MFAKLLKQEWKATRGILGILCLVALGAGIIGGLDLRFLIRIFDSDTSDFVAYPGLLISIPLLISCFFSIFAYAIATFIFLFSRFYSNKFTDQGYLTFTLPVTTHQILLSSFLNTLLWALLCIFVVCLDITLFIFIVSPDVNPFQVLWESYWNFLMVIGTAFSLDATSYGILALLHGFISLIRFIIVPMLAITIGALIAKKHKILAAFGIYWGINTVISILTNFLSLSRMGWSDYTLSFDVFTMLIFPMVLDIGIIVIGYFVMHQLLQKNLNLP